MQRKQGQEKEGSEDEVDKAKKETEEANAEEDAKLSGVLHWLRDREEMLREEAEEDAKLFEEEIYWLRDRDDMLREEDEAAWKEYYQEIGKEEKGSSKCARNEKA